MLVGIGVGVALLVVVVLYLAFGPGSAPDVASRRGGGQRMGGGEPPPGEERIAELLERLEKDEQADPLEAWSEVVAIREQQVRSGHTEVEGLLLASHVQRAQILFIVGRLDEATKGYDDALRVARRVAQRGGLAEKLDVVACLASRAEALLAGGESARATAGFDEAAKELERLGGAGESAPELDERLGHILLSRSSAVEEEDPARALADVDRAVELFRRQFRGGGADHVRSYAGGLVRRAQLLQEKEPERARKDVEEAVAALDKHAPKGNPGIRFQLATTLVERSRLTGAVAASRPAARADAERALKLLEGLAASEPEQSFVDELSDAHTQLGELLAQEGDARGAQAALDRALALLEAVAKPEDGAPEPLAKQGLILSTRCGLMRDLGLLEPAVDSAARAVALFEKLVKRFGSAFDSGLTAALFSQGVVLLDLKGDVPGALRAYARAQTIAEGHVASAIPGAKAGLAGILLNTSYAHLKGLDPQASLQALERAERLLAEEPPAAGNEDEERATPALLLRDRAIALHLQGEQARAAAACAEATALLERLEAEGTPNLGSYRGEVAWTAARVALAGGDLAAAAAAADRAVAIQGALVEGHKDPHELAEAWLVQGTVRAAKGEHGPALEALDRALEVRKAEVAKGRWFHGGLARVQAERARCLAAKGDAAGAQAAAQAATVALDEALKAGRSWVLPDLFAVADRLADALPAALVPLLAAAERSLAAGKPGTSELARRRWRSLNERAGPALPAAAARTIAERLPV